MAVGDLRVLLAMSDADDAVQVWCTWQETGVAMIKGQMRPTYQLIEFSVVNNTDGPATVLLAVPAGDQWWYQIPPGGAAFVLTAAQLTAASEGISISLITG